MYVEILHNSYDIKDNQWACDTTVNSKHEEDIHPCGHCNMHMIRIFQISENYTFTTIKCTEKRKWYFIY